LNVKKLQELKKLLRNARITANGSKNRKTGEQSLSICQTAIPIAIGITSLASITTILIYKGEVGVTISDFLFEVCEKI
jgi:hypothetical protein